MKSITKLALFLTLAISTSASMGAGIIIDGTGPGYIRDGSFEDAGNSSFWKGPGSNLAVDLGITNYTEAIEGVVPDRASDGSYYLYVGWENDADPRKWGGYMDTGYNLAPNDTFALSFYRHVHSGVDFTEPGLDELVVSLFTTTTGDDSGTVAVIIATETVTGLGVASFSGIGTVAGSEVGERLFISATIGSITDTFTIFSFDQVNLASLVPEPSSIALLSLVGLAALRRRR